VSGRALTEFERSEGYTPCKLWLGEPSCGVDVAAMRRIGRMTVCAGTIEECRSFDNEHRFQGQPVPGHPLAALVLADVPTPTVFVHPDDCCCYLCR